MKIGWIGTGKMGGPLCGHLIDAGYSALVHNRDRSKASGLTAKGAQWCSSPVELASRCRVIFTMVGDPVEVEEVILGRDGVLRAVRAGTVVVDMTTSDPELAVTLHEKLREKAAEIIDAPVTGGQAGARAGTLTVMVGGERSTLTKVRPLLDIFSKKIIYMGPSGTGQHAKICNQILVAANMVGAAESLTYATRAGMDLDSLIDAVGTGTAASWVLDHLGRKIVVGDYEPGFYLRHFLKDLGIALKSAERMRLALPGLALARQLYLSASAMGYDRLSTHGVYKVFQHLNAMDEDGV